jgi:hypothetical protein
VNPIFFGGKISEKLRITQLLLNPNDFLSLRVLVTGFLLQISLTGNLLIKNQIAILKKGISLYPVESKIFILLTS